MKPISIVANPSKFTPEQVVRITEEMGKLLKKREGIIMNDRQQRVNKRRAAKVIRAIRRVTSDENYVSDYTLVSVIAAALGVDLNHAPAMWSSGLTTADREGGFASFVEQVSDEPVKTPCHPEGIPGSRYEPHPHFVASDLNHMIIETMIGDRKFIPATDLDDLQDQFNAQADELKQAEDTIEVRDDRIKDLEADIAAAVEVIDRVSRTGLYFQHTFDEIKKLLFAHEPRKPKGGIIVYGGAVNGMAEAMKAAEEGFTVTIVEGTAPHKSKG